MDGPSKTNCGSHFAALELLGTHTLQTRTCNILMVRSLPRLCLRLHCYSCCRDTLLSSTTTNSTSAPLLPPKWARCVDLGVGTGLMGPLLRAHVGGLLEGVDLSANMVNT
jgi:hypothetical protein